MTNTDIEWGSSYDDGRESAKRLALLKKDLGRVKRGPLIDLGANAGFFSYGLADAGFDVTAIEPPNGKTFDDRVKEHRAWVQGPEDLPEGTWDFAIVLSVLHHIPRWRDVLDAVLDRTEKRVYIEVPHTGEQHKKWHGSTEQFEYLSNLSNARIIGEHDEVSKRFKRPLFRVDL